MKYGVIVSRPMFLPYVVPVDEPTAAQAMKVYESESILTPLFVVDFEADKLYRVLEGEGGYTLTEQAQEMLGFRTTAEAVKDDS